MSGYTAPSSRALRRAGLKGDVRVVLGADALELAGTEGGAVSVPLSSVTRLRAGFNEAKGGPYPSFRLWLAGADGLRLHVYPGDRAEYGPFLRALAGRLFAAGVPVETGEGWFVPAFAIGVPGVMTAGLAALMVEVALRGGRWTDFLGGFGVALVLFLFLTLWALRRHAPRRAADPAAFERALPRGW